MFRCNIAPNVCNRALHRRPSLSVKICNRGSELTNAVSAGLIDGMPATPLSELAADADMCRLSCIQRAFFITCSHKQHATPRAGFSDLAEFKQ